MQKAFHFLVILNEYYSCQVIGEDTSEKTQTDQQQPSKQTVSDEIVQLPEYKTLSATTDLSGYSVHTVEDNSNKRILLFKDENGHAKYKTIFMKKSSIVKVINL